jgi:hypothetical protein
MYMAALTILRPQLQKIAAVPTTSASSRCSDQADAVISP